MNSMYNRFNESKILSAGKTDLQLFKKHIRDDCKAASDLSIRGLFYDSLLIAKIVILIASLTSVFSIKFFVKLNLFKDIFIFSFNSYIILQI